MTQKLVNGSLVDLSAEEQAEYDARNAPAVLLSAARAARKAAVSSLSRARQEGGTTVAGNPVPTDFEARALYEAAWADVGDGAATVTVRKSDGTWVQLTAAQFQAVARAVRSMVKNCIVNERAHHEAIDALGSVAAIDGYSIATGWPA